MGAGATLMVTAPALCVSFLQQHNLDKGRAVGDAFATPPHLRELGGTSGSSAGSGLSGASDPAHPQIIFDVRYQDFIPASEEYVASQRPG
jgi:hypothetical protein